MFLSNTIKTGAVGIAFASNGYVLQFKWTETPRSSEIASSARKLLATLGENLLDKREPYLR